MNKELFASSKQLLHRREVPFALCMILVVLLLLIPLTAFLLDFFLSLSLLSALVIFLLTLFVQTPRELASFPSMILFLTLFRLSLSIASTRMILAKGEAGEIIAAFGNITTGGNLFVGIIIFLLLTLVNFVVITKGASRIAEVAARFVLEALPGKQMALDADIASGAVSQEEGRKERAKLSEEAEFYGAMDGASKFVRGDAIALLVMVGVNLLGGLAIGVFQQGMPLASCLHAYARLTIGDALVAQLPALLISMSAAVIITKGGKESISKTVMRETASHPTALLLASLVLFCLAWIPGMPHLLLALLSIAGATAALFLGKKGPLHAQMPKEKLKEETALTPPIEVLLGKEMLEHAGVLFEALPKLRRRLAREVGFLIPPLHIADHLSLMGSSYVIKIKGVIASQGHKKSLRDLVDHIATTICQGAAQLLTRQEVARLIESAKGSDAVLVDELFPKKLSIGQLQRVLQNLLREKIAICDLLTILEAIASKLDEGGISDSDTLTEYVRQKIAAQFLEEKKALGALSAITLDPNVEKMLSASLKKTVQGMQLILRPATAQKIEGQLRALLKKAEDQKHKAVIVTSSEVRRHMRALIEKDFPALSVLSYEEAGVAEAMGSLGAVTSEVLI